jgi:hypothetical protein
MFSEVKKQKRPAGFPQAGRFESKLKKAFELQGIQFQVWRHCCAV